MSKPINALEYLERAEKLTKHGMCVVFGDEPYLKAEVLVALRQAVLGKEDGEFSLTVHDAADLLARGEKAAMRDVFDELSTISMFGGERVVVIEEADRFVSALRGPLEEFAARETHRGTLVLEVTTFQSNTRLYKVVVERGLAIECKSPPPAMLRKWLIARASKVHGAKLEAGAVDSLLELSNGEIGLLDQEVARLAVMTTNGVITSELVESNVGNWRMRKVWDMIDEAADGNAASALRQLDRLIAAGEEAVGLLAQIASPLRRFAAAIQILERGERTGRRVPLREALREAGVKPFALEDSERRLRQIGRPRGRKLFRWLLDADLAIKGESSAPPRARLVLEELFVRLSKQANPALAEGRSEGSKGQSIR